MKIRDKISGEVYEAETWKSWNGIAQYVKKGTNGPIRNNADVEIIEDEWPKDTTDWAAFRREAAKDILCSMVRGGYGWGREAEQARLAVSYAEELIKALKEEKA